MKITIVKDDNAVIVDGEHHTVDCTALPADFHALQWDGVRGEIEHGAVRCDHCGVRSKKGNVTVSDTSAYQPYIDKWREAKVTADAAKDKALQELAQRTADREAKLAEGRARMGY